MRVLVVDDDPTSLETLEEMLTYWGYEAVKCRRAEVALNLLRDTYSNDVFDIVMCEVEMPDMDGMKLLEHVVSEMPDLPVIVMSANSDSKVAMKFFQHGACDYALKPFTLEYIKTIWAYPAWRRQKICLRERGCL